MSRRNFHYETLRTNVASDKQRFDSRGRLSSYNVSNKTYERQIRVVDPPRQRYGNRIHFAFKLFTPFLCLFLIFALLIGLDNSRYYFSPSIFFDLLQQASFVNPIDLWESLVSVFTRGFSWDSILTFGVTLWGLVGSIWSGFGFLQLLNPRSYMRYQGSYRQVFRYIPVDGGNGW